jgi:signal transduction histidine kinase/DNA-binding response OmpR family regulator
MERHARRTLINSIFIMALAAMIVCNVFSYMQSRSQYEANAWVVHSYEVIQKINDILYGVSDSARMEESYLFTGSQPYFLGSKTAALNSANNVKQLAVLAADNPEQVQGSKDLGVIISQLGKNLDDLGKVDFSKVKDPAVQTGYFQREHDLISQVKQKTSALISDEQLLLKERVQKASSDAYLTNILLIVTALLSDFFLIFAFLFMSYQEQKFIKNQMRINEELEKQNRKANESTRLKSEFLANMSHELRTPLNAVIGFSELMQDGAAGPVTKEQHEFLNDILSSAKHLLRLINDVLDLSKVEAGRMSFHPEVINIRNLVSEVVSILHPLIEKKKINFTSIVDDDLSIAYLDPARLKQIIYNYLSNSLKFTPELGTVKIHIKPESLTTLRIEVEDNGIGIKAEDMKRLFIEFEQLDSSVTKKYSGTGLGLALTKRIVEAQGGEVGMTSIPGKGSIFFAILPLTQKSDTDIEVAAHTAHGIPALTTKTRIQNVLVVEDNKNDLEWTANILALNGYAVETAQNGRDALMHCENTIFDLITLDLMLPDINGYEILRQIRLGINTDTPVIVITAATERNKSMGFLVKDYLIKPIDKEKLLSALNHVGSPPHKNHKILVVDDDVGALKLISKLLENEGYDLTCVEEPIRGLKAAEKQLPDVLVLDLMMPGMSGFEFIGALRERGYIKDIPIIIWTAKDLTDEERDFLEGSVQGVVLKSLADSTEKLVKEIKKITSKSIR